MSAQQFSDFKMKGMKFQYRLTGVVATGLGIAILLFPELTLKLFMMKPQDQIVYGISGSVYLAFGILSVLGLKDPVAWLPILLLQFLYKIIWFLLVVGRSLLLGQLDLSLPCGLSQDMRYLSREIYGQFLLDILPA